MNREEGWGPGVLGSRASLEKEKSQLLHGCFLGPDPPYSGTASSDGPCWLTVYVGCGPYENPAETRCQGTRGGGWWGVPLRALRHEMTELNPRPMLAGCTESLASGGLFGINQTLTGLTP